MSGLVQPAEPLEPQGTGPKSFCDYSNAEVAATLRTSGLEGAASQLEADPAVTGAFLCSADCDLVAFCKMLELTISEKTKLFTLLERLVGRPQVRQIATEQVMSVDQIKANIASKDEALQISAVRSALHRCGEKGISDKVISRISGLSATMLARARARSKTKGSKMGSSEHSTFPKFFRKDEARPALEKVVEIMLAKDTAALKAINNLERSEPDIPRIHGFRHAQTKKVLDEMYETHLSLEGGAKRKFTTLVGTPLRKTWDDHLKTAEGEVFKKAPESWVMNQLRERAKKSRRKNNKAASAADTGAKGELAFGEVAASLSLSNEI